MRLDLFMVADTIRAGHLGKLEIGGAFVTTVNSDAEPPITIPTLGFVARFMLEPGDEDREHEVGFSLDTDGNEVFATPPRTIPREILLSQRNAGREAAVIISADIHGLQFPGYGEYRLALMLNGEAVGERFLRVERVPESAADEPEGGRER